MHYDKKMRKIYTNRGYTLLFAVLTSTLVLGVAVFILGVSKKQFMLSVTARDSMSAIYAADSGMECAILAYSDKSISSSSQMMTCGTDRIPATWTVNNPVSPRYSLPTGMQADKLKSFYSSAMKLGGTDEGCTIIIFTTGRNQAGTKMTIIDSRGYNYCTGTGSAYGPYTAENSRTVERGLRLVYGGTW